MADWQSLDPEAAREAQKYENPIPSRELILRQLEERGAPAAREQLQAEFGLDTEEQIEALRRRLRAMERDGQLVYTRRGTYAPVDKLDLVRGRVSGHRDGFGFLLPEDGSDDLFLGPAQMRLVFDGDRVLARVAGFDRRGRREGAIAEILERAHETLIGRYFEEGGIGFVLPDHPKVQQEVLVTPGRSSGAQIGQFVEIRITHWPTARFQAQGDIACVMGDYMAPGMEIDVALRSHRIPHVWPDAVEQAAQLLKPQVSEKDKKKRVDLRHLPFVTIDGEDARDFDDAVYCEKLPRSLKRLSARWRLYVAIADVSHYVEVASALDEEARARGNSVYFPGQVVPMLPEVLSNGLCSLNPEVDRLALVCELHIGSKGEMQDFRFCEAVIHSKARLTYGQVSDLLEQPKSAGARQMRAAYSELVPHLKQLYTLYQVLHAARRERGAIDFDTQETRILFGEQRKISAILPTTRNDAHRLIEECMLAANVASAQFMQELELPSLYRVHDGPPSERLEKLRGFLGELGLSLQERKKTDEPTPKDYQALLSRIAGRPDYHLIQTMLLRSLSQAHYSADNHGHFGLGYSAYTHFTSPIRRYPDLLVHRAIRSVIRSKRDTPRVLRAGAPSISRARLYPYEQEALEALGKHCSMTERRADEATRDVLNWLKCEFMQDRIGETFSGVISSVTGFGLFVELSDIYVEGLVHVSALPDDYYHFDPMHQSLSGERSGRRFRLGDSALVRVVRVDLDERKMDFELLKDSHPSKGSGKAKSPKEREKPEKDGKKAAKPKKKAAKSGKAVSAKKSAKAASRHGT